MITANLTTPVNRIKILLQTTTASTISPSTVQRSTFATIKWAIGTAGLRTLFVGYVPTVVVESFGRGAYFATYGLVKKFLENEKRETSLWGRAVAGASAGVVGWTTIYPMDVCRTRIQAQCPDQPLIYSGLRE